MEKSANIDPRTLDVTYSFSLITWLIAYFCSKLWKTDKNSVIFRQGLENFVYSFCGQKVKDPAPLSIYLLWLKCGKKLK